MRGTKVEEAFNRDHTFIHGKVTLHPSPLHARLYIGVQVVMSCAEYMYLTARNEAYSGLKVKLK